VPSSTDYLPFPAHRLVQTQTGAAQADAGAAVRASSSAATSSLLRSGTSALGYSSSGGAGGASGSPGRTHGPQRQADGSIFVPANARTRGPGPFDAKPGARAHEPLDLSAFLVERERPRHVVEQVTQTDAFAEAPPSAAYRPPKTGVDAHTQVPHGSRQPLFPVPAQYVAVEVGRTTDVGGVAGGTVVTTHDGDVLLFNFDAEVAPIVDTVVDRTLEQAVLELSHERELAALARRKAAAAESNAADAALGATLAGTAEAAAARRAAKLAAARAKAAAETAVLAKASACSFARRVVSGGSAAVLRSLAERGYLRDTLREALRAQVLQPVYAALAGASTAAGSASAAVDVAVADALSRAGAAFAAAKAAEEAERLRKYYIRVVVVLPAALAKRLRTRGLAGEEGEDGEGEDDEADGVEGEGKTVSIHIGPVPVQRDDTVEAVERAIGAWIRDYKPPQQPHHTPDGCPICVALYGPSGGPHAGSGSAAGDAGSVIGGGADGEADAASRAHAARFDVPRLLELGGGQRLHLWLDGKRLPSAAKLLAYPLERLAGLVLQPPGGFVAPPDAAAEAAEEGAE